MKTGKKDLLHRDKVQNLRMALQCMKAISGPYTVDEWQECEPLMKEISKRVHYNSMWDPAWVNRDKTHDFY